MLRRDCTVLPNLFGRRNNVSPSRMIQFGSNRLERNPIILQGENHFSHFVLPLILFREEEQMSNDLTEWQKKADKILNLLQSDASNRQQAITLLDALADGIAADGAGPAFTPLFSRADTIGATFGWMQDLLDDMYWSARREFESEKIFWPLYDIMLRVYPDKAMNLPPTMAVGKCKELPGFLTKPNSVQNVVIVDEDTSLARLHKLHDVVSVSFNMSFWNFDRLNWSEVDFDALASGNGELRLLGPERNTLVYEDANGTRSVRIATGIFLQYESYSLDAHPNLQVVNAELFQITEVWGQKTLYDFLDLGLVHLYLSGDASLTIAERLTSIHLQTNVAGWDDIKGDLFGDLFQDSEFPKLTAITGVLGYNYTPQTTLVVSSKMLNNMPSLTMVYINTSTEGWNVVFKECDDVIHPLSVVVVDEAEQNIFYLFEESIDKTLKERLTSISIGCGDEDFLKGSNGAQKEFIMNASYVHLFYTDGNLSMIRHFTNLKDFHVEQDSYLLTQTLNQSLTAEARQIVSEMGDTPDEIRQRTSRASTPSVSAVSGIRVASTSELMFYYGGTEPYTVTAVLLAAFGKHFREQSFPEDFVSWVKEKGMVRVGRNCIWVNDTGVVRMKAYGTWGSTYLNHVKTYGGTLNLERLLFGLPQGVSNLLPLSMKSMRYNDPAIPVADLLTVSNFMELHVEIPVDVEDVCNLHTLEVLYLNDLGLTELPESIGNMKQLRELHLWGNELKTLPDSVRKLKNLRLINISGNDFSTIPKELLSLPNLQRVIWRGGTEEWERMSDLDPAFAKRVEDGEVALHDADL